MPAEDTIEIINILNLYALALDAQRWDLFDRIFTPDVHADFDLPFSFDDLESWKRNFAEFHAMMDSTQHNVTNHTVHVDGDRATSLCYG